MRILLPTRIPVVKAFLFTCVLVLAEALEGTEPAYFGLVFCFFMLSVFAFNVAGRFTRPAGAYIFFYSTLVAGVGTVYKALLGQAADTHLHQPALVMGIYTATVGAMLVAAALSRQVATTVNGMAGVLQIPKIDYQKSALGCLVVYFFITYAGSLFPGGMGSILHAIQLINLFLPLSILLGTISAVRESNGRRSTSLLSLFGMAYATFFGMLSFSKQAMFTPFACWVIGMAWSGFRMRPKHILTIIVLSIVAQNFFVPLANVGRVDSVTGAFDERLAITEHYVLNPLLLQRTNKERGQAYLELNWYYGKPQGIFDRLTMLPNDSELIDFSDQGHYFGYSPVIAYFENWVPHIISPHKLEGVAVGSGNSYAHELGQLADEDTTTGISYSPSAESFHLGGWKAVLLLQPLIFFLLFVTVDAVCGDLRAQPWGLMPLLVFAHLAPEALLGGAISFVWLGNIGTTFGMFVCGYITPVLGELLRGKGRSAGWTLSPSARLQPALSRANME